MFEPVTCLPENNNNDNSNNNNNSNSNNPIYIAQHEELPRRWAVSLSGGIKVVIKLRRDLRPL